MDETKDLILDKIVELTEAIDVQNVLPQYNLQYCLAAKALAEAYNILSMDGGDDL